MDKMAGVYQTQLKNGTPSFRASMTVHNKHISLGSFDNPTAAATAYSEGINVYQNPAADLDSYESFCTVLSFQKYISLVNFRDNGIYFKTPVYIYKKYFTYYLSRDFHLTFDVDDLFFYTTHSIMKRGGHLFVADYGMQINIMSRYGIKEHAVPGRDYYFANNDSSDFRYGNIVIVNPYHGVFHYVKDGRDFYKVKIHINGDYVVGTYDDEIKAAIAYNKAADLLKAHGCKKNFPENYPESLSPISYASTYNSVKISKKIRDYRF